MRRLVIAAVLGIAGLSLAGCKARSAAARPTQADLGTEESLTSLQAKLQAANDRYNTTCYSPPDANPDKDERPFRSNEPACMQAQVDYSAAMQKFNAAKARAGAF